VRSRWLTGARLPPSSGHRLSAATSINDRLCPGASRVTSALPLDAVCARRSSIARRLRDRGDVRRGTRERRRRSRRRRGEATVA
jgi:hypothetical protein